MPIRVLLIGNPNTGKSTLFGALSGQFVRTGNYPGVTVEKCSAMVQWQVSGVQHAIELLDLPGTYSLAPRSPDELVAVEVLTESDSASKVDVIVCVANALLLERNLFLLSQLLELEKPVVLAINMADVAEARGRSIDANRLSMQLGIPVVLTAAARRRGLDELRAAVIQVGTTDRRQQAKSMENDAQTHALPAVFYEAIDQLVGELKEPFANRSSRYLLERAVLDVGGAAERALLRSNGESARGALQRSRAKIQERCGLIADLESASRYEWIRPRLEGVVTGGNLGSTWTDRIDWLLTGRWTGLIAFTLLMLGVFQLIFAGSEPLMGFCETLQSWAGDQVSQRLPPGMLRSLLVDGVIAGVGGVLLFVPQIALLFFVIAILEDCGYIARAAFLSDRLMSLLGLSGKSFLPLISSFGCAVPGIMATRVIENRRERLVTILIAPLMSCSARLPVYVLLIAALVPATKVFGGWVQLQGLVLLAMYSVGVVVAVPTAWMLRRVMFAGESAPFVLELPEYKIPDYRVVVGRVGDAVRDFVSNAGTLIFAATLLIWGAAYWPGDHSRANQLQAAIEGAASEVAPEVIANQAELHVEETRLLEGSFLGMAGRAIEPVVRPMGWDWKIGVGALASFPAREVIVATLGTIYSLGGDVEGEDQGLIDALRNAKWPDGRPVYTVSVALSVMVFFALCAQCVSTLAIMRRETNSWHWPIFSFVYMTTLAYLGAMATYQIGSRLGW